MPALDPGSLRWVPLKLILIILDPETGYDHDKAHGASPGGILSIAHWIGRSGQFL